MRGRQAPLGLSAAVIALSAIAASPALAVTGRVTDTEGKPIDGARVCHFQPVTNVEIYCVGTDGWGRFEIVDSDVNRIRVSAEGYHPELVQATGHHEIALKRSPTLLVRLVDASSGEPIDEGEVWVVYPSAKRKGPFPVNRAGVRVSRVLEAGDVRLLGSAEGYESNEPVAVKLEPGEETEATLELRPRPAPAEEDPTKAP